MWSPLSSRISERDLLDLPRRIDLSSLRHRLSLLAHSDFLRPLPEDREIEKSNGELDRSRAFRCSAWLLPKLMRDMARTLAFDCAETKNEIEMVLKCNVLEMLVRLTVKKLVLVFYRFGFYLSEPEEH